MRFTEDGEKAFFSIVAMVIVLFAMGMYNTHRIDMMAHTEIGYVIGYVQRFSTWGNIPITVVTYSYKVIDLNTDGEPIVKTWTRTYGGHYDFEIDSLYKVYSVGRPEWLFRSIFSADIMKQS